MMKWITILSLICILPFEGLSISHDKGNEINRADSLKAEKAWNEAALAYEFAAFTAQSNVDRTVALIHKSDCLLAIDRIKNSENTLNRISFFGLSDSLHYQARYKAALSSYLNQNFQESLSQLSLIDRFLPEELAMKSKPLHVLALNETREWADAKTELIKWVNYEFALDSLNKTQLLNEVEAAYNEKKFPKFRKPETAIAWARVIPGTGQLYSGYFFDAAFTSAMVLSGLGIAAYGIFIAKYYVTGVILGYAVFQRFYIAGQSRSEFLANKRNYKSKRKYNDSLQDFITSLQ